MCPCDMNHIGISKHGIICRTFETISNGLGISLVLSSIFSLCFCISFPVTLYLPKAMEGRIPCPEEADPPLTFIIWKKYDRIIESEERIMIDNQGMLVISSVDLTDEGHYTCTPYSPLLNVYTSFPIHIVVKDLPSFIVRPLPIYQRRVGQMVFMPCVADGDPKPVVSWKKADGIFPPTTKTLQDGGNLTIVQLNEDDQGTYECIARNIVTSIITTTLLIVQLTVHSSPYNVTVEVTESTARISWLPPYIDEGQHYEYELWCQSNDDSVDNWQRFSAIPDNVTTVTVYNLLPKTRYKFTILSNYSGSAHFSPEVLIKTKAKDLPLPFIIPDDEDLPSGDSSGSTSTPERTIMPSPGYGPIPPFNITVHQLHNGVNISWIASRRSPVPVEYFIVQYRTIGHWVSLDDKIEGQTHYLWKVASRGTKYEFRVLSFGQNSQSRPSSIVTIETADPMSNDSVQSSSAALGGAVGGMVSFFLVVILLVVAFRVYKVQERNKRETISGPPEYASTRPSKSNT